MSARTPVKATEFLYRRGYNTPLKKYANPDGTASSRVFKLREADHGELSVDVKSMCSAEKSVGDLEKFILFELSNQVVLDIEDPKLITLHDPLEDGTNDAHAVIVGMTMEDEITPGLLARASRRVL